MKPLEKGEAAAYAKHRLSQGLPGGNRPMVHKKLKSGALDGAIKNGKLDHAAADVLWQENSRVSSNPSGTAERFPPSRDTATPPLDGDTIQRATLRKVAAEARGKELDVMEREGALIPVDDALRFVSDALGEIGAALESLPTEMAQACAEEAEPKQVMAMLRRRCDEVRQAAAKQFEIFSGAAGA